MTLTAEADDDGRISIELGTIHAGTSTRLVAGDDGIVRAVTTKTPDEETETVEAPASTSGSLTDEELQAELDRRRATKDDGTTNENK